MKNQENSRKNMKHYEKSRKIKKNHEAHTIKIKKKIRFINQQHPEHEFSLKLEDANN